MSPFSRRDFLQAAASVAAIAFPEDLGLASKGTFTTSNKIHELRGLGKLFPEGLQESEWNEFHAAGYPAPVTGIVYRQLLASWSQFGADSRPRPVSGVPLGGVDTGALYVEASGALGYSSIFNHYTPQGGPLNTPYLGLGIGDKVWVLTSRRTKNYAGDCRPSLGPPMTFF